MIREVGAPGEVTKNGYIMAHYAVCFRYDTYKGRNRSELWLLLI